MSHLDEQTVGMEVTATSNVVFQDNTPVATLENKAPDSIRQLTFGEGLQNTALTELQDRFILMDQFKWESETTHGSGKLIQTYTMPKFLLDTDKIKSSVITQNLKVFQYVAMDLDLEFRVNAPDNYQGCLLLSYLYSGHVEKNADSYRTRISNAVQRPHVFLNAGSQNVAHLHIPYHFIRPYITQFRDDTLYTKGSLSSFVNVYVNVLSGLKSLVTPSALTVRVYVKFSNIHYSGMIKPQGIADLGLGTLGRALVDAAEAALRAVRKDMNRDKPTLPAPHVMVVPQGSQSWSHGTNTVEVTNRLCLDPIGSSPFLGSDEDFSIKHIITTRGYYKRFDFKNSHAPETLLWSDLVSLCRRKSPDSMTETGNLTAYGMCPIDVVSTFYEYWRGGIVYEFKIIKNKFQNGRLFVAFVPGTTTTAGLTYDKCQNSYWQIFDFRAEETFSFTVPFVYDVPWCETNNSNRSFQQVTVEACTGVLAVFAETQLFDIDQIASSSVDVLVFRKAADDFEFAVPRQSCLGLPYSRKIKPMDFTLVRLAHGDPPKEPLRVSVTVPNYFQTTEYMTKRPQPFDAKSTNNLALLALATSAEYQMLTGTTPSLSYLIPGTIHTLACRFPGDTIYRLNKPVQTMERISAKYVRLVDTRYIWLPNTIELNTQLWENAFFLILYQTLEDARSDIDRTPTQPLRRSFKKAITTTTTTLVLSRSWDSVELEYVEHYPEDAKVQGIDDMSAKNAPLQLPPQPTQSMLHFGENFMQIKDLMRRYQFYAQRTAVVNYQQELSIPFWTMRLKPITNIDWSSDFHALPDITREGLIGVLGSGYRFFRGSLRFRITFSCDPINIMIVHVPNQPYSPKLDKTSNFDQYNFSGFAKYVQNTGVNPIFHLEVPYYVPTPYIFTNRCTDNPGEEILRSSSLGVLFMYAMGEVKKSTSISIYVEYALGDDATFHVFQGFPMLVDTTDFRNVTPKLAFSKIDSEDDQEYDGIDETEEILAIEPRRENPEKADGQGLSCQGPVDFAEGIAAEAIEATVSGIAKGMVSAGIETAKNAVSSFKSLYNIYDQVSDFMKDGLPTPSDMLKTIEQIAAKIFPDFTELGSQFVLIGKAIVAQIIQTIINPSLMTCVTAFGSILWILGLIKVEKSFELVPMLTSFWEKCTNWNSDASPCEGREEDDKASCQAIWSSLTDSEIAGLISTLVAVISAGVGVKINLSSGKTTSFIAAIAKQSADFFRVANGASAFFKTNFTILRRIVMYLFRIDNPKLSFLQELQEDDRFFRVWFTSSYFVTRPDMRSAVEQDPKLQHLVLVNVATGANIAAKIRSANVNFATAQQFNMMLTKLQELQEHLIKAVCIPHIRFEPYVLWVHGPPGIGKTYLTTKIATTLLRKINYKSRGNLIYQRTTTEFWNNIANQPVIVYDDYCAGISDDVTQMQINELLQLKSEAAFNPNCASLEDKKRMISPMVVLIYANFPVPTTAVRRMIDPNAFTRRRDSMWQVTLKPKLVKAGFKTVPQIMRSKDHKELVSKFGHLDFEKVIDPMKLENYEYHPKTSCEKFLETIASEFEQYYQEKQTILAARVNELSEFIATSDYSDTSELVEEWEASVNAYLAREMEVLQSDILGDPKEAQQFLSRMAGPSLTIGASRALQEEIYERVVRTECEAGKQQQSQQTTPKQTTSSTLSDYGIRQPRKTFSPFASLEFHQSKDVLKSVVSHMGDFLLFTHADPVIQGMKNDYERLAQMDPEIATEVMNHPYVFRYISYCHGPDLPLDVTFNRNNDAAWIKMCEVPCPHMLMVSNLMTRVYLDPEEELSVDMVLKSYQEFQGYVAHQFVVTRDQVKTMLKNCMGECFSLDVMGDILILPFSGCEYTCVSPGGKVLDGRCPCVLRARYVRSFWFSTILGDFASDLTSDHLVYYERLLQEENEQFQTYNGLTQAETGFLAAAFGASKLLVAAWGFCKYVIPRLIGLYVAYRGIKALFSVGRSAMQATKRVYGTYVKQPQICQSPREDAADHVAKRQYFQGRFDRIKKWDAAHTNWRSGAVIRGQGDPQTFEWKGDVNPNQGLQNKIMEAFTMIAIVQLQEKEEPKVIYSSICVSLNGSWIMMTRHLRMAIEHHCLREGKLLYYIDSKGVAVSIQAANLKFSHQHPESAISYCKLPAIIPKKRSLYGMFYAQNQRLRCGDTGELWVKVPGKDPVIIKTGFQFHSAWQRLNADPVHGIEEHVMQQYFTYPHEGYGMCGTLLVQTQPQFRILGMHVAGQSKIKGFAEAVCFEDIPKNVWTDVGLADLEVFPVGVDCEGIENPPILLPNVNMHVVGTVGKNDFPRQSPSTRIEKSLLFEKLAPTTKAPAPLTKEQTKYLNVETGEYYQDSPMRTAIEKAFKDTPVEFPSYVVREASRDYEHRLMQVCQPILIKAYGDVLTDADAFCGIEGLPYEGTALDTSEGYPLQLKRPEGFSNKSWCFEYEMGPNSVRVLKSFHPDFVEQLEAERAVRRRGEMNYTVYVSCLKDEKKDKQKLLKPGSTRIFSVSPATVAFEFKKYYGHFMAAFKQSRIKNESAVGINVNSIEWTELYRHMFGEFRNTFDGDYKAFGDILPSNILKKVGGIIRRWYRVHYNLEKGCESDKIRKILWLEMLHAPRLTFNLLHQQLTGIPSGFQLTVEANSMCNCIMQRCMWMLLSPNPIEWPLSRFRYSVRIITYGDDIVYSVDDEAIKWFNFETISRKFGEYGITFTDASKIDGEPLITKPLSEIQFLKAKWGNVEEVPNLLFAQYSIENAIETLNWQWKENDSIDAAKQLCRSALVNIFGHGPKVYEEWRVKIEQAYATACKEKLGYVPNDVITVSWWDYYHKWFDANCGARTLTKSEIVRPFGVDCQGNGFPEEPHAEFKIKKIRHRDTPDERIYYFQLEILPGAPDFYKSQAVNRLQERAQARFGSLWQDFVKITEDVGLWYAFELDWTDPDGGFHVVLKASYSGCSKKKDCKKIICDVFDQFMEKVKYHIASYDREFCANDEISDSPESVASFEESDSASSTLDVPDELLGAVGGEPSLEVPPVEVEDSIDSQQGMVHSPSQTEDQEIINRDLICLQINRPTQRQILELIKELNELAISFLN